MFKDRIREQYDTLTPGFRKLADFIMRHTLETAFLTATALARRVDVDPATVVRFAQELGYSGYRELSREIKDYVRAQVAQPARRAEEAEGTQALLGGLFANAQQAIEHFTTTDLPGVAEVVEALGAAPHIWLTGEAACYDLASFMAHRFRAYDVPATAFHPSMGEVASALAQMQPGEVLVAIAGTEPNLDAGYAVRLARAQDVHTIALVNAGVILPAREAHQTVIVPYASPAGVASFGPLMQVMGMIWEAVLSQRSAETAARQDDLHANLEQLRQLRAATPEYEVPTPEA
jgi:DNA-binding MurR/RpiR family transcriptional regulator